MSTRILHCSNSLTNLMICFNSKIVGFTRRLAQQGDLIYIVCKMPDGKTYCFGRMLAETPSAERPWPDADNYVQAYSSDSVEFCDPFEINGLAEFDPQWVLKFLQGAKAIKNEEATRWLSEKLQKGISKELSMKGLEHLLEKEQEFLETESSYTESGKVLALDGGDTDSLDTLEEEIADVDAIFQTINFISETSKQIGLEPLVNKNFFSLFDSFREESTLLLPENRLFRSASSLDADGNAVKGTSGIPDGIAISFNPKNKEKPLSVTLIEYECYGRSKSNFAAKSKYLNTNILPQLMRFASSFSVTTDSDTRNRTIDIYKTKITDLLVTEEYESEHAKVVRWIKELNPAIKPTVIMRDFENYLKEAFKTQLSIMLVIDELSTEQKDTLSNVISAFRLPNGGCISLRTYVVKLIQKIKDGKNGSGYGIALQG